ncbi:unnamed protein product (macronuclear) [Paramecium tetraurelia]|uniref:Small ribosomal subunit protein uS10 n=1 Tax=Paramecium tetraurelia TaxID=5888 RepID=A0BD80_PARTE|nr:uncharacterized protein GSPATT00004591001 [Paramecium tetraurelia]CAK56497.1 unnamed protein product [Paramecium tetraurelia]|eukprot:XP_001423895.1 hypothetical protein (macronuclear) [Paramecium tetraurelia strain d4-2]
MTDLKEKKVEDEQQTKKIRMIVTSRSAQDLENFTNQVIEKTRGIQRDQGAQVVFKGPVRMPTKHLKMTVRKSPCGEGSKTWDRFEMRIHKRVIDFQCTLPTFKDITNFKIGPGINVELNVEQQ